MERTTDEDWAEAMLNVPLMAGDRLYTGYGGRAEIQLDEGIVLWLGDETYVDILVLDDRVLRFKVLRGSLTVSARQVHFSRPEIEVWAPYFTADIPDYGMVRFDVDRSGISEVTAWRGMARLRLGGNDFMTLFRDERVRIEDPDPSTYIKTSARTYDEFDEWCDVRDAMHATSESTRHISERVSGYADLDRHGDWVEVREYGVVWRPRIVVEDWAPYRYGRWVHRPYYGRTWVSYEPWGWVPYHYGRWVYVDRYEWCWVPTDVVTIVHRPIWRPALVSFTYASHGDYFHISLGGYSSHCVGWFPLAPGDPYYPWYTTYHRGDHVSIYAERVDVHIYDNLYVDGSLTVLPDRAFESGTDAPGAKGTLDRSNARSVMVGPEAMEAVRLNRGTNVQTASQKSGSSRSSAAAESSNRSNANRSTASSGSSSDRSASSNSRSGNVSTGNSRDYSAGNREVSNRNTYTNDKKVDTLIVPSDRSNRSSSNRSSTIRSTETTPSSSAARSNRSNVTTERTTSRPDVSRSSSSSRSSSVDVQSIRRSSDRSNTSTQAASSRLRSVETEPRSSRSNRVDTTSQDRNSSRSYSSTLRTIDPYRPSSRSSSTRSSSSSRSSSSYGRPSTRQSPSIRSSRSHSFGSSRSAAPSNPVSRSSSSSMSSRSSSSRSSASSSSSSGGSSRSSSSRIRGMGRSNR